MKKVAIVYWSGTGNTEEMAKSVEAGVKGAGGEASLFSVDSFSVDDMANYEAFAFGCPAMGNEVLEESEFEPFFEEAEKKLSGVPVALFGSYDWGTGTWMEEWTERTKGAGATIVVDSVIANTTPDDDALKACEALGAALANA